MLDKIKIRRALRKEQKEFEDLQEEIFSESYYAKVNHPIKKAPITEKDYFLIFNNKKVGILHVGYSTEFSGKFGIGLIGVLQEYRKNGFTKQAVEFCKKLAKTRKEKELLATIPLEAEELQTVFRNLGFKGSRTKTNVNFDDCILSMLTDRQLAHLDLSKQHKLFKWKEFYLDLEK